jgi:ferrous iron transport protein B
MMNGRPLSSFHRSSFIIPMPTCHETIDSKTTPPGVLTIALAGNPNSGKTTIFNALTGLRQKVANYPGVTVEKKTGRCRLEDGSKINIIDLPGTYSLISRSPDEVVAMEVLRGLRKDTPAPDAVIVVVDASNLQRNLYLVSQMIELRRPMVIALNMMDIARRRGIHISGERLEAALGVPVVEVVGNKHQGITPLKEAIRRARVAEMPEWPLPEAMSAEIGKLADCLNRHPSDSAAGMPPSPGTPGEGRGEGDFDCRTSSQVANHPHPNPLPEYREREPETRTGQRSTFNLSTAERLLIGDNATDLSELAKSEPVASLLNAAQARLHAIGIDPMQADIEAHYQWIDETAAAALVPACATIGDLGLGTSLAPIISPGARVLEYAPKPHFTQRLDRILIHKVWGLLIFAAVMATLFVSIFWLAQPIMDAIGKFFAWLGTSTTKHMQDGSLKDLITQGIIPGVGTVLTFLPQIALLFFFLAILEDSGYLARAAFLMDRLLSKVGLHGKSFIPLLSSFACAIPGIMATRTIENRKDRLATILVAPFMSCSARLPVYTLLIGTFFVVPGFKGTLLKAGIMLACYVLGILAAVITAIFFKRSFLKGMPSSFILEMPTYKLPQISIVARQVWSNASQFVKKAGTTIFALSVILWALAYYPRLPADRRTAIEKADVSLSELLPSSTVRFEYSVYVDRIGKPTSSMDKMSLDGKPISAEELKKKVDEAKANKVSAAQSEYSYAGRFGHLLEPVIRPLGYDWKMGVGLVAAFAAREVFVSTEGIVYATGGDTDAGTDNLQKAMQNARYDHGPRAGQPVWTPLVAVSLLIWFVLAMQCMSTVAIVKRETGGWGWPIFMTLYMNGLAYVVCLIVFQVGTHLGF